MTERVTDYISIENAKIIFKNFSGRETRFNRAGNRNFCVVIEDPQMAEALHESGWNVKMLAPREEGDEARYYINVNVNFGFNPPDIYLIAGQKKTLLDEEMLDQLDYADIVNVDLTFRPYNWEVNGLSGVKAYLKTMYVTIEQDYFADKYDDFE